MCVYLHLLLQAWSQLGCVICVSHFIRHYLLLHAPVDTFSTPSLSHHRSTPHHDQRQQQQSDPADAAPSWLLLPALSSTGVAKAGSHPSPLPAPEQSSSPDSVAGAGVQRPYVAVVPLSAWHCFGSPPFPDFGSDAAARLTSGSGAGTLNLGCEPPGNGCNGVKADQARVEQAACSSSPAAGSSGQHKHNPHTTHTPPTRSSPAISQQQQQQLCIGVLKLSPEKGCSVVLEVARRMPHRTFLTVAGDPQVAAVAAGLPNLQVRKLSHFTLCSCLICPCLTVGVLGPSSEIVDHKHLLPASSSSLLSFLPQHPLAALPYCFLGGAALCQQKFATLPHSASHPQSIVPHSCCSSLPLGRGAVPQHRLAT